MHFLVNIPRKHTSWSFWAAQGSISRSARRNVGLRTGCSAPEDARSRSRWGIGRPQMLGAALRFWSNLVFLGGDKNVPQRWTSQGPHYFMTIFTSTSFRVYFHATWGRCLFSFQGSCWHWWRQRSRGSGKMWTRWIRCSRWKHFSWNCDKDSPLGRALGPDGPTFKLLGMHTERSFLGLLEIAINIIKYIYNVHLSNITPSTILGLRLHNYNVEAKHILGDFGH